MSNQIIVEKNVPFPPTVRVCKYPVHQMEVGDSFFVAEVVRSRNNIEVKRAMSLLYQFCKYAGIKRGFTSRVYDDGFRIWRTK